MSVVRKKPAVWPVVVVPVVILVLTGMVVWKSVSGFVGSLMDEDGRMLAPGTVEVELAEAGEYHVWVYTSATGDDGTRYNAAGPGAGETITVEEVTSGRELKVDSGGMSMSKNVFDDQAESAGVFEMRNPGRVRVTVDGGPQRVVAVSSFKIGEESVKLGMGIVMALGGLALAVVALVVLLVVRARRVKAWQGTRPPPVGV